MLILDVEVYWYEVLFVNISLYFRDVMSAVVLLFFLYCGNILLSSTVIGVNVNTEIENDFPSSNSDELELEQYPFEKSTEKFDDNNVAGIRIRGADIIYLSHDNRFFLEQGANDPTFSSIRFFSQFPKLISVEFSALKLTNGALKNIQNFLPKNILNIIIDSCELEDGGEKLIGSVIKKPKNLKSIVIKFPNLSAERVEKITSTLFNKSNMHHVRIFFDNITCESCRHIASLVKKSKNLETLTLAYGKVIYAEDAPKNEAATEKKARGNVSLSKAIQKCTNLQSLNVSVISMPNEDSKSLFDGIGDLKNLASLNLFLGNLSEQDSSVLFSSAEVLKYSLSKLVNLKSLDLSGIGLTNNATKLIVQSIAYMPELETLNLSSNAIDSECCTILAELFKKTTKLKAVVLRGCGIESSYFPIIANTLQDLHLAILSLGNNELGESIESIPIDLMPDLKFLDFANNDITFSAFMRFFNKVSDHDLVIDMKNNKNFYEDGDDKQNVAKRDQIMRAIKMSNSKLAVLGI